MSARRHPPASQPPGAGEARPEIAWIPQWLDGGALATLGPLAGFVTAIVGGLALLFAGAGYFQPTPQTRQATLSALCVVALALLTFWIPHWWAWRVCGPRGGGRFLGAALWLAKFPPKDEGLAARVLTASALCAGDFLGLGAADGLGLLALALQAARAGDGERSASLREIFVRHPRPKETWSRLVRSYALEAVAATHLRKGDPDEALAWAELGAGRGARYLRRVARRRLGQAVPPVRLALAWLLAPYRLDRLCRASVPSSARDRLDLRQVSPGRLHLELLADAAAGRLTSAPLEELARRWAERLTPDASQLLLRRAADLQDPSPSAAAEELEARLRAELALLAGEVRGEWSHDPEGGLGTVLRQGRAAPLYARLERESGRFRDDGPGRERESSLAELDRWLAMRDAAERLARFEGEEALSTLWFGGLRYAACSWPIMLWNGEGERALPACYVMSRWCAESAERFADDELAEANREMLARCRRRLEDEA